MKPNPPTDEQIAKAIAAVQAIATTTEAEAIAAVLDAQGAWASHVEAGFTEFALSIARAAGCRGRQITGEELASRVAELNKRERMLIDICHAADQMLQTDPPQVREALALLETVRLWSYPINTNAEA